jgi:hypothetical protein
MTLIYLPQPNDRPLWNLLQATASHQSCFQFMCDKFHFMREPTNIENQHREAVGNINFNVNPGHLSVSRTAAGFAMSLPVELSLLIVGEGEPQPLLRGLRGTLYTASGPNANVEVGRVEYKSWHSVG